MLKRLRLIWLVLRVPASGLDESIDSMQEYIQFYRDRDAFVPVPYQGTKTTVVGILQPSTVRPEFPIQPDEYPEDDDE